MIDEFIPLIWTLHRTVYYGGPGYNIFMLFMNHSSELDRLEVSSVTISEPWVPFYAQLNNRILPHCSDPTLPTGSNGPKVVQRGEYIA